MIPVSNNSLNHTACGLGSRGLLKDLKDSKLILNESKLFPWSSRISLVPFKTFRGPLFHIAVTGQELFLAVSYNGEKLTKKHYNKNCNKIFFEVEKICTSRSSISSTFNFLFGGLELINRYLIKNEIKIGPIKALFIHCLLIWETSVAPLNLARQQWPFFVVSLRSN